ncbi:glycoside hydrolase family 30 beta sandwich domain-containing protein [Dysgonomonas sp. 521]|uniref:glycoside hydrolase family 30 protein n=1 Tax=Dysgonomonas sp. 521 TaxID=2302932 RepID=UPI001C87814A|nr:glycoside hydrolase family 30 beta sandwich domain-containing protein [Dysgonomonas sp. 521]
MKNVMKMYYLLSLFLFIACSSNDGSDDSQLSVAPTNLKIKVEVVGASDSNKYGDGSGAVHLTLSATNATSYQIVLPTENNKMLSLDEPGGTVNYSFTSAPGTVTTYPIAVFAYNGDAVTDTTIFVQVWCALAKSDVALWMTNLDGSTLFKQQNVSLNFGQATDIYPTIDVDATQKYQTVDGFGYALTGGSASLINGLLPQAKDDLLKELMLTDSTHIGVSYLRVSIGASDLSFSTFTYNDSPGDMDLQHFNMDMEKKDLIPILQKMLALNPSLKIMGSPWSAPAWMKTNNTLYGGGAQPGKLKPECYDVYARYFVKYIQTMEAAGIPIDAITPQNEPLNAWNNPSMLMEADEQADFVKNHLAPQFKANGIKTKIIIYDHNLDHPEYAIAILNDPEAYKVVDGSAFHLYAGDIKTMSAVHDKFPEKNLYFTEQFTSSKGDFGGDVQWHIENLIVGAMRNWSKNIIEWNLASDPNMQPHTEGGCSDCLGAVTINGGSVTQRNQSYYVIAHAAKFVRPGSVRIASSEMNNLPNVAFQTPDGKHVLIVLNKSDLAATFSIRFNGQMVSPTLPSGSVGTFVW